MPDEFDFQRYVTIMEQEEEDADMVCGSCAYSIRVPDGGELGRVRCFCALDNHDISYEAMAYYFCAQWRQSKRRKGASQ